MRTITIDMVTFIFICTIAGLGFMNAVCDMILRYQEKRIRQLKKSMKDLKKLK